MARLLINPSRYLESNSLLSNFSQRLRSRCRPTPRRSEIGFPPCSCSYYCFPSISSPSIILTNKGTHKGQEYAGTSLHFAGLHSLTRVRRSWSRFQTAVAESDKSITSSLFPGSLLTNYLKFSMSPTLVSGTLEASNNFNMDTSGSEVAEKKIKIDSENEKENRGSAPAPSRLLFVKMTEFAHTPTRGSKFAAGYDLKSAYKATVPARGSCLVKTDIQIQLPSGTYGRVAPRSGLALKNKIDVGAGVIDEDYRGNVGVILFNHSDEDFQIAEGDRIAQLICEKIVYPEAVEVKSLDDSERGEGGFGSTGKN